MSLFVELLERGYDQRSWHGPNLKGSLRGITPQRAAWRPGSNRHNIWEIVVHAAYWKYVVRRRLTGEKRGSFPLKGSDWFRRPEDLSPASWKIDLQLLDDQHFQLVAAVGGIPDEKLELRVGKDLTASQLIQGAAMHDIYHAGQIRLLRRLLASEQQSRP